MAGRPRWFDLPMIVWCLCPIASALTNEPPPDGSWPMRDGLSQALQQTVTWGIPYLLGRIYFTDWRGLRDLAVGMVLAAVAYVPLCLIEVRLSPQVHRIVYGFSQHSFVQTMRFGGYRPMVFVKHGLTLAMWMVSAGLIAAWLWQTRRADRRGVLPPAFNARLGLFVLALAVTAVLLKSSGALVLGLVGWAVLLAVKCQPSRGWLVLLMALPVLYVAVRVSGAWSGEGAVELAKETLGADRAQSFEFRLDNEDKLISRALEQPAFGWGGWGRARVFDRRGNDTTVTDGLWIIALGDRGYVGLLALGGVLLLPPLRFALRFSPRRWADPFVAPATVCAVILVLWAFDCTLNAGFNHIYPLMGGALAGMRLGVRPQAAPQVRLRWRQRARLRAQVRACPAESVTAG